MLAKHARTLPRLSFGSVSALVLTMVFLLLLALIIVLGLMPPSK